MKLLIVESPSKAKTIEKYLGKDFRVVASVGHIRDLPKSNKNAIDIEAGFVPHYEVVRGKEKVVSEIKRLAKGADEVILATDPDREGEAIAWHISEAAGLAEHKAQGPEHKLKRIVFYEITKEAVQEALKHPRGIDINLKEAQEARRVLDRLVGYDLSGLIWKKVRYGLSAGRVQSPALRIIMEREREIRAFKPEKFWKIFAALRSDLNSDSRGPTLAFECSVEPRDKAEVDRILETGRTGSWAVTDIKETMVSRAPRPPFTTSTLQQTASSRLGFTPARTMAVAQRLYEAGHITYMRTDSTNLGAGAKRDIESAVKQKFGEKYFESHVFAKKSKNAQEAHEAVRPTNMSKDSAGATEGEKKLYRLIWQRTAASQMKSAEVLRTKIVASPQAGPVGTTGPAWKFPDFWLNGSRILFDGWLRADTAAAGEDVLLPEFKAGDKLTLLKIEAEEKETQPPARYSEAGLVKELEKRGIGRPSTYASIIKTLEDREYVENISKALHPTDTGEVVSNFLEEHFPTYISDSFTAEMEDELDEIARGERTYVKTLSDFYKPFQKDMKEKEKVDKATTLGTSDYKCPTCDAGMIVKLGKSGKFLSCERFPDCIGTLTMHGEEVKPDEPIGIDPETNLPVYLKMGRFGPFVQLGPIPESAGKKKKEKPLKSASVPRGKKLEDITLDDAIKYLSLPRTLGKHPETGEAISANIGRFGPYIALETKPKPDFRSLKTDDPYTITLERALEILNEPKKTRRFKKGSA